MGPPSILSCQRISERPNSVHQKDSSNLKPQKGKVSQGLDLSPPICKYPASVISSAKPSQNHIIPFFRLFPEQYACPLNKALHNKQRNYSFARKSSFVFLGTPLQSLT